MLTIPVTWFLLVGNLQAVEPVVPSSSGAPAVQSRRAGAWLVQETANFRVWSPIAWKDAAKLPTACEALRRHLRETWLDGVGDDWSPKCEVVIHSTVAEYVRALGPGSEQSSGCATIEIEPGRVTKRRIDLRCDAADCFDSSLPHELTHVVVAERFTHRRLPRWADEGMAILAEPLAKQQRRRTALERSLAIARPFSAAELTGLADYPAPQRHDAFYGQSASLVAYLIERESPAKFLEFVELSTKGTPEQALMKVYGVATLRELDRNWRSRLLTPGESAELLATRVGRITAFRDVD
ncbi:MAG TPA: hypothetical protein VL475_00905 [Planctomycetaceae bacterium]|nr:hypothetical protein [Planctomycetaceae bacterium]